MTEFFKDSAVSWIALINGAQTIERAIFAAQSLHSNSYRHCSFSPSKLENGRGDDSSATQSTRVVFQENNSNLLPLESSVAYEKPQILGAARKNPDAYTGNLPGNSGRQVAHLTKESNRPLKLLKDIKGCLKEQQRKPVLPATDCTHFRQWRHSQDCVNLPHAINLLTNAGKTHDLKDSIDLRPGFCTAFDKAWVA